MKEETASSPSSCKGIHFCPASIVTREVDLFSRPQIRLRTTFNGNRLDLKTGCQINDREAWDEENELVKGWYVGPKNESAQPINNELRNVKDQMDTAFKYFEAMDTVPSVVMKWTGHSDYKAMNPYIDIVDSIKAQPMTKFNNLL